MSWQATNWALEQHCGSPGRKLVLLCLANEADRNGRCSPTQAALARDTEQGERTVRGHLAALEEMALISRQSRRSQVGNDFAADEYQLAVPWIHDAPAEFAAATSLTAAAKSAGAGPPVAPAESAAGAPASFDTSQRQVSTLSPPNLPPHPPLVPPLLKSKESCARARPFALTNETDQDVVDFPRDWKPDEITLELLKQRGFSEIAPMTVESFVGHWIGKSIRLSRIPGEFLKWVARERGMQAGRNRGQQQAPAAPGSKPGTPPPMSLRSMSAHLLRELVKRQGREATLEQFAKDYHDAAVVIDEVCRSDAA